MTKPKMTIKDCLTSNQTVKIGKDQALTYVFFTDDRKNSELNLEFRLTGRNSSVKVLGFNIGRRSSASVALKLIHEDRDTAGRAWMRSVLDGGAKSRVQGLIKIGKKAVRADGFFSHDSLLLSKTAHASSSPALEIETHEVKASHAATTGHLDEDALFYLNCRGIGRDEARRLVMVSFVHGSLGEIADAEARKSVGAMLEAKIAELV